MHLLVAGSLAVPLLHCTISFLPTRIDSTSPFSLHESVLASHPPFLSHHTALSYHGLAPSHLSSLQYCLTSFSAPCFTQLLLPSSMPHNCWLGRSTLRSLLAWLATAASHHICHEGYLPKTPPAVSFLAAGACGSLIPEKVWRS